MQQQWTRKMYSQMQANRHNSGPQNNKVVSLARPVKVSRILLRLRLEPSIWLLAITGGKPVEWTTQTRRVFAVLVVVVVAVESGGQAAKVRPANTTAASNSLQRNRAATLTEVVSQFRQSDLDRPGVGSGPEANCRPP